MHDTGCLKIVSMIQGGGVSEYDEGSLKAEYMMQGV